MELNVSSTDKGQTNKLYITKRTLESLLKLQQIPSPFQHNPSLHCYRPTQPGAGGEAIKIERNGPKRRGEKKQEREQGRRTAGPSPSRRIVTTPSREPATIPEFAAIAGPRPTPMPHRQSASA